MKNRRFVNEADPFRAGMQVDFERGNADRSRYSIGHNIHPASEMEDEMGGAPYDGAMVPGGGGMGGDMGAMPGAMPGAGPDGMPADDQLQPVEPGMGQPAVPGSEEQLPPMKEAKDAFDLYLDALFNEHVEDIFEAGPFDFVDQRPGQVYGGPRDPNAGAYRGGGRGDTSTAPRNYAGFSGQQAPPPSIQAGGPQAVANWQAQMARVGGGGGEAPARRGGGSRGGGRAPARAQQKDFGGGGDTPQTRSATAADEKRSTLAPEYGAPGDGNAAMGLAGLGTNRGIPQFQGGRAAQLNPGAAPTSGLSGRGANLLGGGTAGGPTRPGAAGVGRAAQLATGQAAPGAPTTPGSAPAAASGARGADPRFTGAQGAGNLARGIGRASPVIAGGVAGADEYNRSGDATRAGIVGTGASLGSWGGAAGGAATGAALGALGGPLAPVTVPAGALIGGVAGGYAGGRGGEWAGGKIADQVSPTKGNSQTSNTPAATAKIPPAPGATTGQAGNLAPGGALKTGTTQAPAPQQQAAAQPTTPNAAGATGNLVPGGALKTQQNASKDWGMNWADYNILHESDRSREKKIRGY